MVEEHAYLEKNIEVKPIQRKKSLLKILDEYIEIQDMGRFALSTSTLQIDNVTILC